MLIISFYATIKLVPTKIIIANLYYQIIYYFLGYNFYCLIFQIIAALKIQLFDISKPILIFQIYFTKLPTDKNYLLGSIEIIIEIQDAKLM